MIASEKNLPREDHKWLPTDMGVEIRFSNVVGFFLSVAMIIYSLFEFSQALTERTILISLPLISVFLGGILLMFLSVRESAS